MHTVSSYGYSAYSGNGGTTAPPSSPVSSIAPSTSTSRVGTTSTVSTTDNEPSTPGAWPSSHKAFPNLTGATGSAAHSVGPASGSILRSTTTTPTAPSQSGSRRVSFASTTTAPADKPVVPHPLDVTSSSVVAENPLVQAAHPIASPDTHARAAAPHVTAPAQPAAAAPIATHAHLPAAEGAAPLPARPAPAHTQSTPLSATLHGHPTIAPSSPSVHPTPVLPVTPPAHHESLHPTATSSPLGAPPRPSTPVGPPVWYAPSASPDLRWQATTAAPVEAAARAAPVVKAKLNFDELMVSLILFSCYGYGFADYFAMPGQITSSPDEGFRIWPRMDTRSDVVRFPSGRDVGRYWCSA